MFSRFQLTLSFQTTSRLRSNILIILGVDPGLQNTGWGVIRYESGKYQPVSYGIIKTKAEDDIQKRIYTIADDLASLAVKYRVDVVSMEDIFFTKNISSAIPVAKVIGAVLYKFSSMNIKTYLYSPKEIKLGVVGVGNAEKEQVQDMVRRILKLKEIPRPDHAADALADCICYITHNNVK